MTSNSKITIHGLKQAAVTIDSAVFASYKDEVVAGTAKVATGFADLEIAANRFSKIFGVKPASLIADMKKAYKANQKNRAASQTTEYTIEDGCLTHITATGPKKIADCAAKIVTILKSEDGNILYKVKGKVAEGEDFSFNITAEDFSDQRILKTALEVRMGHTCTVAANMSAHLGPAIKKMSDRDILTLLSYNTTGWKTINDERRFLIPGNDLEGVEISLPNPKHCYHISKDADPEKALEALDHLLMAHPPELTTVAFAFIMQPPLAELAGWQEERYCLFIQGLTGSLKTAFVQTLMCVWGEKFCQDSTLVKWGEGATNNAIMALASAARDMPFLLDNYKPNTGGGAKAFINIIQNILEGGEKERLQKNSELRVARKISAWPLCTGEDIPNSDAATIARLLVMHVPMKKGFNEELRVAQNLSAHLNAIGAQWLHLLEYWADKPDLIQGIRELSADICRKWSDWLQKNCPKMINKLRIAMNLASNEFTWRLLLSIPQFQPVLQKYSEAHAKGLMDIALNLESSTREATEAERFLDALREAIQTGQLNLNSSRGFSKKTDSDVYLNYHGWWENQDLCISPEVVIAILKRTTGLSNNEMSKQTLYRQLNGLGAIAGHDTDLNTKTFYIDGKTCRALYLKGSFVRYQIPDDEAPDGSIPF